MALFEGPDDRSYFGPWQRFSPWPNSSWASPSNRLNLALPFGLPCSSLLSQLLARILLGQFRENPPWFLSKFVILYAQYLTTLACFQQNSCQVGSVRIPLTPDVSFLLVVFHPLPLPLGCKSPFVLVVFKLSPISPPTTKLHCSSALQIKSALSCITSIVKKFSQLLSSINTA